MQTVILKCLAGMLLLLSVAGIAQDKKIVKFEFSCSDQAKTGDTIMATVIISVAPGWHVYAPVEINRMQQMQLTQVRFTPLPSGLRTVGSMKMPPEKQKGSYVVYEGENNRFVQLFVVNKPAGEELLLQGKLTYQACNQTTCFPPVTERFEKVIRVGAMGETTASTRSGLPSVDSAKAIVEKACVMFASDEEYEAYLKLSPLRLKQYEDNQARRQAAAALWFCQNYPPDTNYIQAVALYLRADPHFIDSSSSASLDTITHYKGMDWTGFMRSLPVDTMARNNWLKRGDSMVARIVMTDTSMKQKEALEFLLFARDFRTASGRFGLLPRNTAENSYWSIIEQQYWAPVFDRFRQHVARYADFPILADRAQDFLASLKSRAPETAASYWQMLEQYVDTDPIYSRKKGYVALRDAAREQLSALAIEKGEKPLMMAFTSLDGRQFDLAKHKGKIVVVDFWASWCTPCVAELPYMRTLYEKYKSHGLEIAGICLDDQSVLPKVNSILKKNKVAWPQRFEGKGFQNDTYRLLYGINSLPTVWVVDGSGKIVSTTARGAELEALIDQLLNAKQPGNAG